MTTHFHLNLPDAVSPVLHTFKTIKENFTVPHDTMVGYHLVLYLMTWLRRSDKESFKESFNARQPSWVWKACGYPVYLLFMPCVFTNLCGCKTSQRISLFSKPPDNRHSLTNQWGIILSEQDIGHQGIRSHLNVGCRGTVIWTPPEEFAWWCSWCFLVLFPMHQSLCLILY